ncbi:hypothetical protein UA08_02365 [Talaromyces atroroseus]|uniref:DNA ligase D 3'-phosphoesterase domain-containing protein n=1 Tax=Talaromyces atroroseus TaxID=1441469 RepID=A0A225B848_TALAT|nr:hypothetical protein UA08_02365 [Talaromyces atroroseus]OKL62117.1 hypothetical protein UA08_02365 [Talaromyces atroroseus]
MKRSYISETNGPAKEPLDPSQIWNHSTVSTLSSLTAPVSPPRKKSTAKKDTASSLSLAAVEAGQVTVDNPVELFSARLAAVSRPQSSSGTDSRISYENWLDLYARNQHENGHHFVIHQHDHPIAGPHYDLRLQFSDSSSLSWAIMYGLPGDPNSRRINRNATETRVHCLWNHMMEMGSRNTGSMIIWDTGEYEVLPYHAVEERPETDDSASDISNVSAESSVNQQASDSQRLKEAFQNVFIPYGLYPPSLKANEKGSVKSAYAFMGLVYRRTTRYRYGSQQRTIAQLGQGRLLENVGVDE